LEEVRQLKDLLHQVLEGAGNFATSTPRDGSPVPLNDLEESAVMAQAEPDEPRPDELFNTVGAK
jgi:hypothetical protein